MSSTDVDQTLQQLEIIFQKMIMGMLGLLNESPIDYDSAARYVRVSWPTGGQPGWGANENITFIRITEDDDNINRQREDKLTESEDDPLLLNEEMSYTRVINLGLIFYGPNSWSNAQTVRDYIFRDSSSYRRALGKDKIYLIPDVVAPRRIPEPFVGQWFQRVDLNLRFNENVKKNADINTIGSVPIDVYNANILIETDSFTVTED